MISHNHRQPNRQQTPWTAMRARRWLAVAGEMVVMPEPVSRDHRRDDKHDRYRTDDPVHAEADQTERDDQNDRGRRQHPPTPSQTRTRFVFRPRRRFRSLQPPNASLKACLASSENLGPDGTPLGIAHDERDQRAGNDSTESGVPCRHRSHEVQGRPERHHGDGGSDQPQATRARNGPQKEQPHSITHDQRLRAWHTAMLAFPGSHPVRASRPIQL